MTQAVPRRKPLTEREIAVLTLLAEGKNAPEIAKLMWISVDTVRSHKTHLYEKLGAKNSAQAVAIGFRREILL